MSIYTFNNQISAISYRFAEMELTKITVVVVVTAVFGFLFLVSLTTSPCAFPLLSDLHHPRYDVIMTLKSRLAASVDEICTYFDDVTNVAANDSVLHLAAHGHQSR